MLLRFLQDRCGYLHSQLYFLALPTVLTLFVLLQNTLLAQAPQGSIRGVVKDVTGAVVTKMSVRVSQLQVGGGRVVGTNAFGQYYITNLEPGDYEIEAFATGFNTEVQRVTLRVGDELTVNFQLHPGSVNERVLVSGQTSGINTSDFAVNGSLSQVQVQNLPLNGRNFFELARKRSVKESYIPSVKTPKPDTVCRGCGTILFRGRRNCRSCAVEIARENMAQVALLGHMKPKSKKAKARMSGALSDHAVANTWWDPSSLPSWLNEEYYVQKIQPLLRGKKVREIAEAMEVSQPYAALIRSGRRRPHPRHWQALGDLVGVSRESPRESN